MYKRIGLAFAVILSIILVAGCQEQDEGSGTDDLFFYTQSAEEIADWGPMDTPGGGEGSVEMGDDVAVIKAAEDGWGGIQSEPLELDLSKDPLLFVRVKENADEFQWGAKFVPSSPELEDHEWGLYVIEDNNFKWNNYAVVNLREKLEESFIDLYGEEVEGVLWIHAAGGPEATVEVSEVKIMNQK